MCTNWCVCGGVRVFSPCRQRWYLNEEIGLLLNINENEYEKQLNEIATKITFGW